MADMSDPVELTDLDIITRYSIAVRTATAERDELIETLRADLSWLESGRLRPPVPIRPEPATDLRTRTARAAPSPPAPPAAPEPGEVTAPIRRMSASLPPRMPAGSSVAKSTRANAASTKAVPKKAAATKAVAKKSARTSPAVSTGSKPAGSGRSAAAAKRTAPKKAARSAGSSTARGGGRGRRR
jgi:hypothetical protein